MTIPGTNRAFVLIAAFALAFSAVSWRLIYIQVEQHEKWAGKAAEKHAYKRTIPARRGMILDRNGVILAQNEPIKTVVVDGTLVRDNQRERLGEILSKHLAISHDQVMEKLGRRTKAPEGGDRPSPYIVIKKEVSE
jgi:cell division protein FtsI/penicillin-binding protein 2